MRKSNTRMIAVSMILVLLSGLSTGAIAESGQGDHIADQCELMCSEEYSVISYDETDKVTEVADPAIAESITNLYGDELHSTTVPEGYTLDYAHAYYVSFPSAAIETQVGHFQVISREEAYGELSLLSEWHIGASVDIEIPVTVELMSDVIAADASASIPADIRSALIKQPKTQMGLTYHNKGCGDNEAIHIQVFQSNQVTTFQLDSASSPSGKAVIPNGVIVSVAHYQKTAD